MYEDGRFIVVVMDASMLINLNSSIIHSTVMICGVGLLLTFLAVFAASGRMIRPEIENARRQKMFITNASHELKTPLAVIRANTELEELMNGETEWTQSTLRQVDRLNGLIQNLVMIARAQEKEEPGIRGDIDASAAILDTVTPYESMALQQEKTLTTDIVPDIHMNAVESRIRQLTVILIDNAFKYCDEKGTIRVVLDRVSVRFGGLRKNSAVRLMVSNSYAEGEHADYTKFFERFYREDESHNADRGGYGIGLSVAESLCRQYQGRIRANWKDGMIYFICEFPLACDEEEKP
jgi:signal transduction histidine kinase